MGEIKAGILGGLLSLLWWAIVISAILSWLVAFDVINRRNNAVYQILDFLDRVTGPVLRPASGQRSSVE